MVKALSSIPSRKRRQEGQRREKRRGEEDCALISNRRITLLCSYDKDALKCELLIECEG
jgi:hypothetical protein